MSTDTHQTDNPSPGSTGWLASTEVAVANLKLQLAAARKELEEVKAGMGVVQITPAIRAAIDSLKHPRQDCCQSDQHYLERIVQLWSMRQSYQHRVDEAFKKHPHAGLEYVANELEWDKVLGLWGKAEAVDLIERLCGAADEGEVARVIEDWEVE